MPRVTREVLIAASLGLLLGAIAAAGASGFPLSPAVLALVAALTFVLASVAGGRRFLVALVVFDLALRWDVNFAYRDEGAYPGGIVVSLTTLALAGLYAQWLAEWLTRRGALGDRKLRVSAPIVAYAAVVALSLLVASDRTLGAFAVVLLLQYLLVSVYVASTFRGRDDFTFLAAVLMLALLAGGLSVIWTFVTGHELDVAGITGSSLEGPGTRSGGTLGSPNVAGTFFAVLLPVAVSILATSMRRGVKALALCALVVGTVALILTFSRGGWVSFGLALAFLVVVSGRNEIRRLRPYAIGATLVVVAIAIPFGGDIAERVRGDRDSIASRAPLVDAAYGMISDHPLLGVGINNYPVVLDRYKSTSVWGELVHNEYLRIWAESGPLALLCFLLVLALALVSGRRAWRAGDSIVAPLALGFTASIVALLPNMAVERFVNRPQVTLLWLAIGVLAALSAEASALSEREQSY